MSETASPSAAPVDIHHVDDIDIRAIVVWGLVSVFITVITIAALGALYKEFAAEQRVEKTYNAKYTEAASALDLQAAELEQPIRYLDQQGSTVGVPIGIAEALTIKEYTQEK